MKQSIEAPSSGRERVLFDIVSEACLQSKRSMMLPLMSKITDEEAS
jgi:hypothetical protein